jgi:peptide/nickel transport system substrate-binding protein
MRRSIRFLAAVATIGAAAATSTLITAGAVASRGDAPKAGGVYRVAFEQSFGFTDGFDPTGEYYTFSFAIESNLIIRTLVGYDHVAGPAGNKLVPDLATTIPKPTGGGKTYTFHLKPGVKFGPPVSRPVTSNDVLYALERLAHPKDGAEYAFYYSPIVGFDAYAHGKAKTIAGIQTPNPSTIVFHLSRPIGDFLYRMAMPATGPIPPEVGRCFEGEPGKYGKDIVSTGPTCSRAPTESTPAPARS